MYESKQVGVVLFLGLAITACLPSGGQERGELPEALRDLPLVELPVGGHTPIMAFVMSGDGNWANFIREFADTLVQRGIPVVGLESRAYLSTPKTEDELGRDMERVLRHYSGTWGSEHIIVVGYSRGADFAPFMVNRVSPELRRRIQMVVLLSPTKMASFEFHLLDLIKYTPRASDVSAVPEVDALQLPVLCVYGTRDDQTLCPLLPEGSAEVVAQDAGHRLHSPGRIAEILLQEIDSRTRSSSAPPILPP